LLLHTLRAGQQESDGDAMHRHHSLTWTVGWFCLTALLVGAALQAQRSRSLLLGTSHEVTRGAGSRDKTTRQVTGSATSAVHRPALLPRAPAAYPVRPPNLEAPPAEPHPGMTNRAGRERGALIVLMMMAQGARPLALSPR